MVTVDVPMAVERHRLHAADGFVELWGHVGDYEVMVCLPLAGLSAEQHEALGLGAGPSRRRDNPAVATAVRKRR